jgi:uncharacterized protein
MKSERPRRRAKLGGDRSGLSAAEGGTINGAADEPSPFVVSVVDLLRRPGHRREVQLRGRLTGLRSVDTSVDPDLDIEVFAGLEAISEGLVADGRISAPWRSECRRCLREVEGRVEVEFRELFEARPRDGETYLLGHEEVDLEPLIREAVLLALPLTPLCRAECEGICPTCGADLNEGPCGCPPGGRDPRWAALDDLHLGS